MIYTVTANPAVDYTVQTPTLSLGETNRVTATSLSFGGKGINVSRVLTALGVPNRALGFVAGETGNMLEGGLRRLGLDTDFIRLSAGATRINIKLCSEQETEINATGPVVEKADMEALTKQLAVLKNGDVLCLCGSLPPGCGMDFYAELLQNLRGVMTVVDTVGEALLATLPYHPLLIKPNRAELCALVGRDLSDEASVVAAAKELQAMGAQNVLVSLGGDGAVLVSAGGDVLRRKAYCGEVRGTVGAGDSMVAGFVAAYVRGEASEVCLDYAVAAGCATAFVDGLADRAGVETLLVDKLYR